MPALNTHVASVRSGDRAAPCHTLHPASTSVAQLNPPVLGSCLGLFYGATLILDLSLCAFSCPESWSLHMAWEVVDLVLVLALCGCLGLLCVLSWCLSWCLVVL